ncbi:DNA adenine methylase [Spiroplasma endosymbiont of Nebria brevicollis]|uniref:DNA adenine methylase n=1 Tax=Spiroplasma endosymbiont of Nebria brevicollis TaxID=3066284 RepID=UPI00313B352F
MDRIANTVGHYDAYIKNGLLDKKIFLELVEPLMNNSEFFISNADITLENNLPYADIVYLDPPYNSRQYSSAYHLLENITEWKKEM